VPIPGDAPGYVIRVAAGPGGNNIALAENVFERNTETRAPMLRTRRAAVYEIEDTSESQEVST